MALISIIQDFHPLNNAKLLGRAAQLAPVLHHAVREPVGAFLSEKKGCQKIPIQKVPAFSMKKGNEICLDFGEHMVGYLTLE